MAVIRQHDAQRLADRALMLDLGDLKRQGEAILARAREQGEAIVAGARRERERIGAEHFEQARREGLEAGRKQGLEEGRRAGHEAGLAERREAVAALEKAWAEALKGFEARRVEMHQQAREDVLRLAVVLAERVVKRALETDPSLVVDQVGSVIGLIGRPTRLRVHVHPDDKPLVREALPGLCAAVGGMSNVELLADPLLARGSCVVRTEGGGEVDASIAAQLDRIAAALLPAGEGP
ncbi:MAG TPA: FliH/SctL family protein [Phycisphaerales bacterium]|nr:FliH/SctL family protein [Phycisphaerales bacterium]